MNLSNITKALGNIKAHPWTTIGGALLAAALAVTNTANLHDLLLAFGVALLGALAKDPNKS